MECYWVVSLRPCITVKINGGNQKKEKKKKVKIHLLVLTYDIRKPYFRIIFQRFEFVTMNQRTLFLIFLCLI